MKPLWLQMELHEIITFPPVIESASFRAEDCKFENEINLGEWSYSEVSLTDLSRQAAWATLAAQLSADELHCGCKHQILTRKKNAWNKKSVGLIHKQCVHTKMCLNRAYERFMHKLIHQYIHIAYYHHIRKKRL